MSGPIQNGFQGQVNNQPAPGEGGDFYGVNPRVIELAGPGQYVAPAGGLIVGNFCWADPDTGAVSQSYVPGNALAFLHRENNALITDFLGVATLVVPAGFPITLFSQGDFWAKFKNSGVPGDAVYADEGTGEAYAGSTAPARASVTASAGFSGTAAMGASFTGVIATNVLTVSALTGYVSTGDVLAGAGITPGTLIGAQLTGPAGGAGTYTVTHGNVSSEAMTTTSTLLNVTAVTQGSLVVGSVVTGGGLAGSSTVTAVLTGTGGVGHYTISGVAQSSASGTKTSVNTTLNVTAVSSGPLEVGDILSGSGVTSGTQVVAQLTGTPGGIGTYQITPAQEFASTTVTVSALATQWKLCSRVSAGDVGKISTW